LAISSPSAADFIKVNRLLYDKEIPTRIQRLSGVRADWGDAADDGINETLARHRAGGE
jgi:hypothetical protein